MKSISFRLLFATACCFLIASGSSHAQTAKWDSTYRPSAYQLKVDQFRAFPNSKKDIIFLGNSITAGIDWIELFGNKHVRNRGISGDITYGVLERLDEVIEGKPAKVFILIGTNDISRDIPDDVIVANYKKIISRIKAGSPKTRIYFQTILPTNASFGKFKNHYNKSAHTININNQVRAYAEKEGVTVIDLYTAFLDSQNNLEAKLTHDGLHLTMAGYERWAELLRKKGYLK